MLISIRRVSLLVHSAATVRTKLVSIEDEILRTNTHSTCLDLSVLGMRFCGRRPTAVNDASGRDLEIGRVKGFPTVVFALFIVLRATRAIQRSRDDFGEVVTTDVARVDGFATRAASLHLDSSLSVVVLRGIVVQNRNGMLRVPSAE
jgi:hypothetical protein